MKRIGRLTGFVMVMIGVQTACADQGIAVLRTAEPAFGVPPVTYNSNVPAPLWLPPPPSPWSTPVVAVSAGTVVAVPTAPVVTYRPLLPVIPMPGQYYPGRGLLGQPKLYVPNQPLRNFVRYLSP